MDTALLIIGGILILAGMIGSFVPFMPGPPLAWLGLLAAKFSADAELTWLLIIIYAVLTAFIVVADNIIAAFGNRFTGGTKYGTYGSIIGMIAGMFIIPAIGLIFGTFLGAVAGELISGKNIAAALKSGIGIFLGFIAGSIIKFIICALIAYHFIAAIY